MTTKFRGRSASVFGAEQPTSSSAVASRYRTSSLHYGSRAYRNGEYLMAPTLTFMYAHADAMGSLRGEVRQNGNHSTGTRLSYSVGDPTCRNLPHERDNHSMTPARIGSVVSVVD